MLKDQPEGMRTPAVELLKGENGKAPSMMASVLFGSSCAENGLVTRNRDELRDCVDWANKAHARDSRKVIISITLGAMID